VVVLDRCVYGGAVDLTGTVAVRRFGDMRDEVGQSRFAVGSHGGGPPICRGAHGRHPLVATRPELLRRTGGITGAISSLQSRGEVKTSSGYPPEARRRVIVPAIRARGR
jgi:hypothetical protein